MLTGMTGACNKTKGLKIFFGGGGGGQFLPMLSEFETIESIVLKWL